LVHTRRNSDAKDSGENGYSASDVRELPADQQIIQALNRLTFAPSPATFRKYERFGLDNWIDQQLHPEKIQRRRDELRSREKYSALNEIQNDR